jgi:hypothetical protein
MTKGDDVQSSGPLEWAVGRWAQGVGLVARDAHGKPGKGANTGTLVIGREERGVRVANREDSIRITDSESGPCANLHAPICEVHGLNEPA